MAEAFVSVLLEQLASITYKQIKKEVRLVVGVEKEVAKITSNLKSIQAVLEDADKRQVKEAIVRDWVEKLKDVSYEMDDVLDDWSTEIIIQHIDHDQQEGESSTSTASGAVTKKKVCFFIPSNCFCFGKVNRVIHCRDIAIRIQDLSDRLNEIARERQNYNFQSTERVFEELERFETSSFVDLSKTFGRENESKVVIDKLVGESSQEARNLPVIPIVGMGGLGKTTLAQMVYNDENVKLNFTKRIWVCVSDPFNVIKIARAIIEDLNVAAPNTNDLQPLLKCIHYNVEGQKFLLVLDDVWNEDYRKWEQLKLSLQSGLVGSRILVTTRKEEVAVMMGATTANMIHLEKLSEECCWSIFYHIALTERERNNSKEFEPLGKRIVKRCHGLPLVAKALGGLMRSKKTKREWVTILESKIWELDIVEKQVFQPLLLSYYDLSPIIKRCLLYCVIFPKNHIIDKQTLIELWMSQGYLSLIGNKKNTIMNVGESYFDNLVMRSFFQNFKKNELGYVEQCQMHDIVHDFLQFLSKSDCFILEAQGENRLELPMRNKFRHLTITGAPNCQFPVSLNNCKSLRTLATFNCKFSCLKPESVLQLKCVRTLNLSGNGMEQLPNVVGRLVHLRYLDLSYNRWKKLPDSLCDLINLETLRFEVCKYLEELPEAMGKLTNLRHLHVMRCYNLKLPKSIAKLTSLQTLDRLTIFAEKIDVFKLSHLGNMDQIQGKLIIALWDPAMKDGAKSDAEQANLVNKKHLVSLTLSFWADDSDSIIQEEMLNALRPNPNLESLWIGYYSGATLYPNWMSSLNNLRCLTFGICGGCKYVPLVVLGKLVSLEILQFWNMSKVEKVGFESTRITDSSSSSSSSSLEQVATLFPNLKELEFIFLPKWEEWEGMPDSKVMPRLSTLEIRRCPKLNTLPDFLRSTPLQNLSIQRSEILSESCKNRGGTVWPNISHIPNIQINRVFVKKDGVWNHGV